MAMRLRCHMVIWPCSYVAIWMCCKLCEYSEFCTHPPRGGRLLMSRPIWQSKIWFLRTIKLQTIIGNRVGMLQLVEEVVVVRKHRRSRGCSEGWVAAADTIYDFLKPKPELEQRPKLVFVY